jgi:transcriptional regulator with XRE-family HTH domain
MQQERIMDNMITFISKFDVAVHVAARARERRLAQNLSRKTLAEKSGVTEASIKRFESTGEVSFASLLKMANALGCMEYFEQAFAPEQRVSLEDVTKKPRARGRG